MTLFNQFIFHFFVAFLLYASKSTKSRTEDRKERLDSHLGQKMNSLQAGCPPIPKCQWARFEELKLKVQQGAQSSVSVLIDHFNKEPVVKKIFSDKSDFVNEMKALSCIRIGHNPLLVYPLCVDPMKMVLVLEWGGEGDMTRWDLFRDDFVQFTYSDVVKLSAQIIASVAASHRRGFLHGDIKPENFVVNLKQKSAKLIDFGLSAKLGDFRIMSQGTPQTMAPEVAFPDFYRHRLRQGPYAVIKEDMLKSSTDKPQFITVAMDWWSVGVTIHYVFAKFFEEEARKLQSDSESSGNLTERSSKEHRFVIDEDPYALSDDHYFPYKIIWSKNGNDISNFKYRPVPESFPPALKSLLNKLMAWDPLKRNFDVKRIEREIFRHEFFDGIDWNEIDPNLPK